MALLSGKFQPQMLEIQLGNDIQPQLLELSILNLNLQRIHWVFYPVGSYRNSLVTTMNLNQLALPMMGNKSMLIPNSRNEIEQLTLAY